MIAGRFDIPSGHVRWRMAGSRVDRLADFGEARFRRGCTGRFRWTEQSRHERFVLQIDVHVLDVLLAP